MTDEQQWGRVLYVDDEAPNLDVFELAFDEDFEVFTAQSAAEAIELLARQPIDLLITDQRMPEMTGVELLETITETYPDMVRMVLTGYTDIQAIIQAVNLGRIHQYLTKPYDPQSLRVSLRRALELHAMQRRNKELLIELEQAAERARAMRRAFQKYVPEEVVNSLIDGSGAELLAGESRDVTVVFVTITDFRATTVELPPEDVVGFLNRYIAEVNRVVLRHQGLLAEIGSDELLLVFGAPNRTDSDESNAVAAVQAMMEALPRINEEHAAPVLGTSIRVAIGIHRGEVIVGNIGSARKMKYGIIGDTVNVAARIRDQARGRGPGVLLSGSVVERLQTQEGLEPLGAVQLRGRDEPVELYRLQGAAVME